MFTNPLAALSRLMALPEMPPGTNVAPAAERVPWFVLALSKAVGPATSSNFQWAIGPACPRAWGVGASSSSSPSAATSVGK